MPFCSIASRILTHAEIAARLGVSVHTIDRHLVKAWEHLRGHFGRGYEG